MSFHRADQDKACSRPLSQPPNALLKSQGGWDVLSYERSGYLDKRLSRLGGLRQRLRVGTHRRRHQLRQRIACTFAVPAIGRLSFIQHGGEPAKSFKAKRGAEVCHKEVAEARDAF